MTRHPDDFDLADWQAQEDERGDHARLLDENPGRTTPAPPDVVWCPTHGPHVVRGWDGSCPHCLAHLEDHPHRRWP